MYFLGFYLIWHGNYIFYPIADVVLDKGKLLLGPIGVNKSMNDPLWKPPADWYDDDEDDVFGKDKVKSDCFVFSLLYHENSNYEFLLVGALINYS